MKLPQLTCLIDSSNNTAGTLAATGLFVDTVPKEVREGAADVREAFIFNANDCLPPILVQSTLISLCSMTHQTCSKLRKKNPKLVVQIYPSFVMNYRLMRLTQTRRSLKSMRLLKMSRSLLINPFQRDKLRSQKFSTTSQVDKTSLISGAPPPNIKLPVHLPPDGPNSGLTAMGSKDPPSPCHRPRHKHLPLSRAR